MTRAPSRGTGTPLEHTLEHVAAKLRDSFSAAATGTLCVSRTGSSRCADAGNDTAHRDRYAERRFARQRGNGSACGTSRMSNRSTLGDVAQFCGGPYWDKNACTKGSSAEGGWSG